MINEKPTKIRRLERESAMLCPCQQVREKNPHKRRDDADEMEAGENNKEPNGDLSTAQPSAKRTRSHPIR